MSIKMPMRLYRPFKEKFSRVMNRIYTAHGRIAECEAIITAAQKRMAEAQNDLDEALKRSQELVTEGESLGLHWRDIRF